MALENYTIRPIDHATASNMRYLSVCSGIEAASVAWHHLGWTPVAFSEIEPFPSAVLAHRFPNVPNLGDMTRHAEWPLGPGSIDLLVGGTPCQSFSVAGLRKGLSDPRGGLMLTYLEIAQRLRPRWVVWENVPGVLSSGRGRDFGSFLGALGELGYGWAYRVLDAQWVRTQRHPRAVPQRRRRVFVVGCLGDATRAAQVLFERESVQRDSAPRRASREGAAADAEGCARAGRWWNGEDCAGTLTKSNANGGQRMPDEGNFGAVLQPVGYRWQNDRDGLVEDGTAPACRASAGSSGFHEMNHPVVVQQPVPVDDASPTLTSRMQGSSGWAPYNETAHLIPVLQPVPFTKSKRAQPVGQPSWPAEVAPTLTQSARGTGAPGYSDQEIFSQGAGNLVPQPVPIQDGREMQKAQNGIGIGQQGDPAYTLDTTGAQAVAHPVAFQQNTRDEVRMINGDGRIAGALAAESGMKQQNYIAQPVAFRKSRRAQSVNDHETWVAAEQANTLNQFDTGERDTHAVLGTVDMQGCKGNANVGDGSVSPTLCKPSGNDVHAILIGTDLYNGAITGDVAATMGTPGSSVNASGPTVMAFDWQSGGYSRGLDPKDTAQLQRCQTPAVVHIVNGNSTPETALELAFPLRANDGSGNRQAVAFTPGNLARGAGPSPNAEVAPTRRCSAGRGADDQRTCVAFSSNMSEPDFQTDGTTPTVKVDSGLGIPAPPAVAHALAVRTAQTSANGHGIAEGVSHTLDQAQGQAIAQMMTVRRLTPRECERLQGFPDDWTLIPWRGKAADECPDGPRYKALGNSMACNCMAWIGERINTKENT